MTQLIPSVYAAIEIQKHGLGKQTSVGFSGPTYIAIRSGKHSTSTAYAHGLDLERLVDLEEFKEFSKKDGWLKPVLIMCVDGGPDENPRYQKVANNSYIQKFKVYQLINCVSIIIYIICINRLSMLPYTILLSTTWMRFLLRPTLLEGVPLTK